MKRTLLTSGLVAALAVSGTVSASAQTAPGSFSVTVSGGWEPGIGGTMHEGGSGTVLTLPTVVGERSWTDTHRQTGLIGSAGFGVGVSGRVEAVGNVEFGRVSARELEVGTVATLPLFAEFDDYKYWGMNGGARVFLASGGMSPYVTATVGFRRVSELGGTFTVPAASVTLEQSFFDRSTVPTFGADFGVLFGQTRARVGVEAGLHWTGAPQGAASSFAGTGLENLNDEGARLSVPIRVVVRF